MRVHEKQRLDYYFGGLLVALCKPVAVLFGLLLRRDHALTPQGTILVFKFQGGGSLVLAAPALAAIRERYQGQRLILVTTRGLVPFGHSLGVFDDIRTIDDRSLLRMLGSGLSVIWRSLGADTVIDLEVYSRLSGMLALATLARNRIGFFLEATFWRRGIYTHLVFFNRYTGVSFFYDQIAHLLEAPPWPREQVAQRIAAQCPPFPLQDLTVVPFVAIGPGCSDMAVERRMPTPGWVHYLTRFAADHPDHALVILGGAGDHAVAADIVQAMAEAAPQVACRNLCGQLSLGASIAVLQHAAHYVGIDSAPLHYARLLGVPSTSFWGPVSPAQRLQPWSDVQDTTHYVALPCSPCVHVAETPPCRGNNACMRCLYDVPFAATRAAWLPTHTPWRVD